MGLISVVVFLALTAISTSTAFVHVTPHNKEIIYNWNALIRAGTLTPTTFGSQFILNGKVHIQCDSNATFVKITDLTYKLYNGILDHVHEHEAHSVPVQLPDLEKPFKVVYDAKGLAVGIVTHDQEKEFTRNIKKAIATTFQMDHSVLEQGRHHHPYSSVIKEHSIYGHFDVDYTVERHENGDVHVHKLHDMHETHHLYTNLISNNEAGYCDLGYENPLMHNSVKEYIIKKDGSTYVVHDIHTIGTITYQPFKGQSDHQFILVNQTFHLGQVVPMQEHFVIQGGHFEDHLTYHSFVKSEDGAIHDVTNGRHIANFDKLITTVQHMLDDIHDYLHQDHIHTKEPDSKRGQLVNRVQRLLQVFTLTKLQELHKKLSGHSLNVFYNILPLVGTQASTLFIKHLVVNQVVSDEVAIGMLQHLPEHVVEPTIELLQHVEEFIHLGENVHWHVRKTALLSFATLIHKSHVWYRKNQHHDQDNQTHDHHLQQPYEKYVIHYINMLRSSHDYKVQMVCMAALSNMKLYSIIQHMLPAVNGEWYNDPHFRFFSMWSVGQSVIAKRLIEKDHHVVIETLWPIFTDIHESTEMRTLAFYYIMESIPTESNLINMFSFLLKEQNQEVYKFVYTYLHDMMESNDACKQEFKVRVAHLVKLLPPPTHGISSAHVQDYKDVNFGFGGGLSTFFVNGNYSSIYAIQTTTQHFNIHHEEYIVVLKVAGLHHHGGPIKTIVDILKKQVNKVNKELHIEFTVMRHGSVITTHFFNEDNLHELDEILNFFTKESHSLTKELLHITYDEYHSNIIPTDLGTPAVWEYLVPVVHHGDVKITKEVVNKVVNLHIDNKYVNWIHYRHGLSFYNPVADVWQGINRLHSFDAVWPLHFDITLNMQQQSLQISWKKSNNVQNDVMGLRSHVKQMVFVIDDYNRNILIQSSPHCKEFVVVTHGKEFRHDYTINHDDDLSTGHQWHVGFYDSSRHVSNGSFNSALDLFTQSHSKHSETPITHFLVTAAHFQQFVLLLPQPGTYGFIVRVEPSHHHQVTSINLSLRLHQETVTDETFFYSPKLKWSTRMTYSIKNQETSLKTWDINAIIDMNPGHTINNLKMHITRTIPGQNDYKICADGIKKWTEKGVEGHLNVAMSQTPDGKCVKDDTVIDVTMTGHHSQEQVSGGHKYGSCEVVSPYSVPHKHSLQCLADHSTVRHYIYNVKTTNVPTEFRKIFVHWWDIIKGHYMSHYDFEDEHDENIGEHNFRVDVEYPMQVDEVDVHVTTPQHVYKLTGVPNHFWRWVGVYPDSLEYPEWFQFLHELGWVDHCVVEAKEVVQNDWTLYVGNVVQNPQKAVYVKSVGNGEIGIKVVDQEHTLEIVPHGATHQITLDGQVVPVHEYHHENWVYCHVFTQDTHHPVAVMLQNSGIHVEYQHNQVVIVVPKVEQQLHGQCFSHH